LFLALSALYRYKKFRSRHDDILPALARAQVPHPTTTSKVMEQLEQYIAGSTAYCEQLKRYIKILKYHEQEDRIANEWLAARKRFTADAATYIVVLVWYFLTGQHKKIAV
jgi:hypothetical protein